jgi:two-component system NtrC family sensor kinase
MKFTIDKESSELLCMLDALGLPAFIVDRRGTILSCNEAVLSLFEHSRSEVIGRWLDKFVSLDVTARAGKQGDGSGERSFCFRKNSPPFSSRIAVVPNKDSRPDRINVVVRDLPGQKPQADTGTLPMQDSATRGELINELSSIINSSLSIGTIFRMVVSELRKIIDYSRASLLLYSEKDDDLLIFALDTDLKTEMKKGVKAPIAGTSAGWVVRNNKPWISYDLKDSQFELDGKLLREGIRSTISIPLFHDRMLGVFNFDSEQPSNYSETDFDILLPVAKQIAIALENALLFEEISREKKEWERTFDAITDMVWIEDGRQQVIRANQTLLMRTGFSKTELVDKHCAELLERIGVVPMGCCLCSETLAGKRPSFQELKSFSGGIFHFWAYPLIDDEGRLYAIVHYLKDVTAQKRIEQQLIRSDKLASLGTLVAGIAHEINNPMGIIAGYSEALLDRAEDESLTRVSGFEDFPAYLKTIHNEIFRCKTILKTLLEFARPSSGTFREIDINELIKEVLLLLKHRTARLQHALELDLTREIPKIHADAGSLRQLLMNLLLNAIYFTPEGGSISISTGPEERQASPYNNGLRRIRLSVSDTGTGIPSELVEKVFDPFFTTKPVGEGTGLGLTICHRIVEEHGGTIDVKSEPGKGTTFTIILPAIG